MGKITGIFIINNGYQEYGHRKRYITLKQIVTKYNVDLCNDWHSIAFLTHFPYNKVFNF